MEIERIREKIYNEENFSDVEKYIVLLDDTADYVLREGKFGIQDKTIHTMAHYIILKNTLRDLGAVNIPNSLKNKIAKVDLIGINACEQFYKANRIIGALVILMGIGIYFFFGFALSITIITVGIIWIITAVQYFKRTEQFC